MDKHFFQQSTSPACLSIHFHPKQATAFLSHSTELLYGGASGGGKSWLMRIAAIIWASEISGLQIYIFRRIRDDLIKNHMEGPKGFRAILAQWTQNGFAQIVENEIRFWNGSKIYLCHCQDERDIYKYQGTEIHVLLIDELTHFTQKMYNFLRHRVRMSGISLPIKYKHIFPRILCGSNPGNIGHLWVKQTWIDNAAPFTINQMPAVDGGMRRQFIPARLDDNPSLIEDDPDYEARLEGLGSKELVRAMRWGDWDILEGAFFDCWDVKRHVIKQFVVPPHWTRFMSIDWGSAHPCAIGWFTIVPDEFATPQQIGATPYPSQYEYQGGLPRGAIVQYRERYLSHNHNNVGLKKTAEEVAQIILEAERTEPKKQDGYPRIAYRLCDRKMRQADGGPSLAERMGTEPYRLYYQLADDARTAKTGAIGGWDQLRARLMGDHDNRPMLYFMEHCVDSIRTIPALQHDPDNPEDIMDHMEDHAPDMVRYAVMSRPYSRQLDETKKPQYTVVGINQSRMQVDARHINIHNETGNSNKPQQKYERIK